MRDSALRMVWIARILTVFCLQAVSDAEDTLHLQTHNSNLTLVATENLDGHIELSTLDLVPTTATTQSTHSSHPKKILRHLIKRPIHQNSSSKINRNDALTNRVGFEENKGDDGFVLTDTSKTSSVTSDVDDKHKIIDEKHKNYSIGGGISEEKGSGATGSERVDNDKDISSSKVHGSGTARTRKVLKHINKRLLLASTTSSVPAPESTTQSNGPKVDRKKHRRTFLENRRHLKPIIPMENSKINSQITTSISSLDLVLESTSSTTKSSPENDHTITDITRKEQEDSTTHKYPEHNDQDILFTQTGLGHDESLFEFTGSTERDLFDIGISVEGIYENPSKRVTVSLPKSFSEGNTETEPTQTSEESTSGHMTAINLHSRFSENPTVSDDVSMESNSRSGSSKDIFENVNFSLGKSFVSAENLKITTPEDIIPNTNVHSTTYKERENVSNDVTGTVDFYDVPIKSTSQDDSTTEATTSSMENPDVTIAVDASTVVLSSMSTKELFSRSTESTTSISNFTLENMLDNSNSIVETSPNSTEDPNVTMAGGVIAMVSTRGKVEVIVNKSKEDIAGNDSSIQPSTSDSTSTLNVSSTMTIPYLTTTRSGITTVPSATTIESREMNTNEILNISTKSTTALFADPSQNMLNNVNSISETSLSNIKNSEIPNETITDEVIAEVSTNVNTEVVPTESTETTAAVFADPSQNMLNNVNFISETSLSNTKNSENPNVIITDEVIAEVATKVNTEVVPNESTETTAAVFTDPSQNMLSNVNNVLKISVLSSTEDPDESVTSTTLNTEEAYDKSTETTANTASTASKAIEATHDTMEAERDPSTYVSDANFQLIDHAHETDDAKIAVVLYTSSTTEETTISTRANDFATEEMVTVDPSHWYGIDAGDGIIEVHPDTEISENVTEVFEDEQKSTINTATDEMLVEDTTIEGTIEQIVTVPPSQWYGINTDDSGTNEVLDTSEIDISTIVADTSRTVLKDRRPAYPEELTVQSKTRSDKALPLYNEIVVEHELLEQSSTNLITTSGVESYEEDRNTSVSIDNYDNSTVTTELTVVRKLISTDHTIIDEAKNFSSSERYEDKNISNNVSSDIVEYTTRREEVAFNTTTFDSDILTVSVQTLPKDKVTTYPLPTTENSFSSTFGQTVTTTEVTLMLGTEHPTVDSAIQDMKKITSTVEDRSSSVIFSPEEYSSTELITKETPSNDENSIDPPEENVVPSKIYIWTNPEENITNTVESDVKDISVIAEDHDIRETVRTEQKLVLNQSSTVVEPHLKDSELSSIYFLSGNYFGNDSVYIVNNILGNPVNISIRIQIEDDSEYIPSDAYILEDLENKLLNFTWVSARQNLNNSLALRLNQTEHLFMISRVYLNIFKGGSVLNLKRDIKNEPQVYKMPQQFNYMIDLSGENKVTFSNLNFLTIPKDLPNKNVQRGIEQLSKERYVKVGRMEIVILVIIIIALLLIVIYVLLERRRRKTVTKTVADDKCV